MQSNNEKNEFPNLSEKIYNQIQLDKKFEKKLAIQKRIAPKTYDIDFEKEMITAKVGGYLFSLISIICALYFIYSLIIKALPIEILAWIIATFILTFIEALKHFTVPKMFRRFFNHKTLNIPHFTAVVALTCISVYLSVKGIEQYANEKVAEKPQTQDIDKIAKDYDNKISNVEKQKTNFIKSVSWNDKINVYDKTTSETIKNFDNQIKEIQKQRFEHTQRVNTQNNNLIKDTNTKNETNILYLVVFALLNEIFCLLCLWYPIYYDYVSSLYIEKEFEQTKTVSVSEQSPQFIKKPIVISSEDIILPSELKKGKDDLSKNQLDNPQSAIGFKVKGTVSVAKEIVDSPQGTVSVAKEIVDNPQATVSVAKEIVDNPQAMVSVAKEMVATAVIIPKATVSVAKETVSVPHEIKIIREYKEGKGFLVQCENCGDKSYKKSPNAKFCSANCRTKKYKENKKQNKKF